MSMVLVFNSSKSCQFKQLSTVLAACREHHCFTFSPTPTKLMTCKRQILTIQKYFVFHFSNHDGLRLLRFRNLDRILCPYPLYHVFIVQSFSGLLFMLTQDIQAGDENITLKYHTDPQRLSHCPPDNILFLFFTHTEDKAQLTGRKRGTE